MNRKDQHVSLAKAFYHTKKNNDFDAVSFVHSSIVSAKLENVDLSTEFSGFKLDFPFYINAMTGGSPKTKEINQNLAIVARETGLMMATGSASAALRDPAVADSYGVVRKENPDGLLLTNIGAGRNAKDAEKVIDMMEADGLQVHLNVPQEIVMPEGDWDFSDWQDNLTDILTTIKKPIIIKEVGFGMSRETIQQLLTLGARNIDVSGNGGTSFTQIENTRRKKREFDYLDNWGQSTVISLLEAKSFSHDGNILASGGIRNAFDIFKALSLGAQAVGVSATFLDKLLSKGVDETIAMIESWKNELRHLYVLTDREKTADLIKNPIIISGHPKEWAELRNIDLKKYAQR